MSHESTEPPESPEPAEPSGPSGTPEPADAYAIMDLALRVGEVLLSSGAGAADVEAQMDNIATVCGLRRANVSVTFTELAMTHQPNPDVPGIVQIRHVRHREVDYEDLTNVDHVVRDLVEGRIEREEASKRVKQIVSTAHARPRWATTVGWGVMGGGASLLLGGDWITSLIAVLAAICIDRIQKWMTVRRYPTFYQQIAGGLLASLLAIGCTTIGLGLDPSRVITSSIILLLAGVMFLGAIQDALTGFPLTAGARILEAFIATAGTVAGVSGGLTLARVAGVDMPYMTPGMPLFSQIALMTVGGVICAAAFAYSSYAPLRSLPIIGIIGGAATFIYLTTTKSGVGFAWASALAAIVVGFVSYPAAKKVRVPALVVIVSAVVPLLPGLSIFRGLTMLGESGSQGILPLINAAAVAIAISAGAIFGEYVAQPLGEAARRSSQLAGPRLVGPFTVRSLRRRKR